MYVRNNATAQYQPLVTPADDTAGTAFGGKLEFAGAAPDLAHVVFASEVPLTTQAVGEGLYEWEAGAPLKLVSLLPEREGAQTSASEPLLGGASGADVRNAISTAGSRVFWTNGSSDEGPLFMTNTARGETIQVNAAQGDQEAGAEEHRRRPGRSALPRCERQRLEGFLHRHVAVDAGIEPRTAKNR